MFYLQTPTEINFFFNEEEAENAFLEKYDEKIKEGFEPGMRIGNVETVFENGYRMKVSEFQQTIYLI